jgi:hypothetical protein
MFSRRIWYWTTGWSSVHYAAHYTSRLEFSNKSGAEMTKAAMSGAPQVVRAMRWVWSA